MKTLNKKLLFLIILFLFNFVFTETSSAITRGKIVDTAEKYMSHSWIPTENNICHENGIDTPDRNTSSNSNWSQVKGWKAEKENSQWKETVSVPYQWGGCSSIKEAGLRNIRGFGDFDEGVKNEKCAGDISCLGGRKSGSVGVDCSGFVSRCWNLKSKKSTRSLPKISKKLKEYNDLIKGDILNKSGHVMLFERFDIRVPTEKLWVHESSSHDWKVNYRDYEIKEELKRQGYKPYTYLSIQDPDFSLTDVEILVDRSESMSGWTAWNKEGTKMDRAKEIARYFVDSLRPNSRVGLTTFNNSGYSDYPLTLIDNNGAVKTGIKETIDAISHPDDDTYFKEGLGVARERLNAAENNGSTDKTIILITDGFETSTHFLAEVSLLEGDIIPNLIEDGIKVYIVRVRGESGFNPFPPYLSLVGPKNSGSKTESSTLASEYYYPNLDHSFFYPNEITEFLESIADATGGKYYTVNSSEDFQGVYNSIAADLYYEDKKETKLAKGKISQGGVFTESFLIDPSIEEITFSLTWPGSDLDLILTRPDGTLATGDDPDIYFASAGTYETYTISQPMNGEWQLKIIGVDVSPGGENYTLAIGELGGMDFEVELDREEYSQGDLIKITAGVVDQTLDIPEIQYLQGIEVEVKINGPGNKTYTPVIFSDDGFNGDEEAGDGIYTGVFSKTSFVGEYSFTIKAWGGFNDETESPFEKTEILTAFIKRAEKKKVVIAVSDKEGSVFDEVTLEAEVKDEDGKLLTGDSNKITFKVNNKIIGNAVIDNSGKAEILWTVDLIPEDLIETYPIAISIGGSQKYFSAEEQGEFVLTSAQRLKREVLGKLETLRGDNKRCQKNVRHAVKFIKKSLNPDFWLDASYLNLNYSRKKSKKSGVWVFNYDGSAVKELLKIVRDKNKCSSAADKNEVWDIIDKLVQADKLLVEVILDKAGNSSAKNSKLQKKINRQIKRAEKSIERANQELGKNKPDRAIRYFKNAWIHSQIAVRMGN